MGRGEDRAYAGLLQVCPAIHFLEIGDAGTFKVAKVGHVVDMSEGIHFSPCYGDLYDYRKKRKVPMPADLRQSILAIERSGKEELQIDTNSPRINNACC